MLDLMWLFTVPVLKFAIKCGVGISAAFLLVQVYRWYRQAQTPNPFSKVSSDFSTAGTGLKNSDFEPRWAFGLKLGL